MPMKRLYAGQMRDFTFEEWLTEVSGLVSALSASETLLLRRLRQLRGEMEAARLGPLSASPFDPRPRQGAVTTIPVLAPEWPPGPTLAPAEPDGPIAPPAYVAPGPQWASQTPANWPADVREDATAATSTTRSYDYFAELDEKLAVLHQSGREA